MKLIASLQSLLASVSKTTKLALGRVGMFSVASLNAIVCLQYNVASYRTWLDIYLELTLWKIIFTVSGNPYCYFRFALELALSHQLVVGL